MFHGASFHGVGGPTSIGREDLRVVTTRAASLDHGPDSQPFFLEISNAIVDDTEAR